jgi:hypothetical protein
MRAFRIVAIAAVLLAGCRVPPPAPPAPPPQPPADPLHAPAREGAHVRMLSLQKGFLEIRIEAPDAPPGPKPTVLSLVEAFRGPLLDAGFTVVSYALHWERLQGLGTPAQNPPPPAGEVASPSMAPPAPPKQVGKWLLASPSADVIGKGYLSLVDGNARSTVPDVLRAIATDPDVDRRRIGMLGFSTNGFQTLQAASVNRRIRVAVSIAACGDYHTFLRDSSLAMEGKPLTLAPDYERWLRKIEPVRHPQRLVHTALLMVNGRKDLPIPIACAERTAWALRRAYAAAGRSDRFRFVVIDEGHVMGGVAQDEAMRWLKRWLPAR